MPLHVLKLLRREQDLRLARAAVEAGLLDEAELVRLTDDEEGGRDDWRKRLIATGVLSEAAFANLERRLAAEDFVSASAQPVPLPAEVTAVAGLRERQLGQFVLVERLGRGGAGEVWKSWDRKLGRFVAVKLSTAAFGSQGAAERFAREAAATARLDHPHIVPVYQVGFADDRPFFVMRLIEGGTLDQQRLPLTRALAVVQTAAQAVAYAHGQGLVHRDLKPANIMVDGKDHVWVLDFGLVHWQELAAATTRPGDVLGTAAYMSPEQAAGTNQAHAPTTDVYGLGATLYTLVTGSPPFVGASFAEIVAKVLNGAPIPARRLRPNLPRGVERVLGKAMHKEPARRYDSAEAFADDLGRLLEHLPIKASRSTWRWPPDLVKRWPGRTVVLTAALVLAAFAFVFGRERETARREREITALQDLARVALDTALRLRRAGDHRGMGQLAPPIEAAYRAARLEGARAADLEQLMARLLRALMRENDALVFAESALARSPDLLAARYERAVLLSRKYGRARESALTAARALQTPGETSAKGTLETDDNVPALQRPELRGLRERMLEDLRHLEQGAGRRGDTDATTSLAAGGILAHHLGRSSEAKTMLEEAIAAGAQGEEVWETLAAAAGRANGAMAAEEVLKRAIERDRGYVPHWVARCRARVELTNHEAAIADASEALRLDRAPAEAWMCRATARVYLAHLRGMEGRGRPEDFTLAEQDLSEVQARNSEFPVSWARGTLRRSHAQLVMRKGGDPLPDLDAAELELSRALAVNPRSTITWATRGYARSLRGAYLSVKGSDPAPAFASAVGDLAEAIRRDPGRRGAWEWRAEVHVLRGIHAWRTGENPEPAWKAAEADFAQALPTGRGTGWARWRRALLNLTWGRWRADRAQDPLPSWQAAETDLEYAARRLPKVAEVWTRRAQLHVSRALHLRRDSPQRARDFEAAAKALDQAETLDKDLGELWLLRSRLAFVHGRRQDAVAFLRRALHCNPLLAAEAGAVTNAGRRGVAVTRTTPAGSPSPRPAPLP